MQKNKDILNFKLFKEKRYCENRLLSHPKIGLVSTIITFSWLLKTHLVQNALLSLLCKSYLEQPWEDISGLAADNKEARIKFAEAGIQVFQTLQ